MAYSHHKPAVRLKRPAYWIRTLRIFQEKWQSVSKASDHLTAAEARKCNVEAHKPDGRCTHTTRQTR